MASVLDLSPVGLCRVPSRAWLHQRFAKSPGSGNFPARVDPCSGSSPGARIWSAPHRSLVDLLTGPIDRGPCRHPHSTSLPLLKALLTSRFTHSTCRKYLWVLSPQGTYVLGKETDNNQ